MKIICSNKKAFHDYFIEETFECGLVLAGSEVKSLRLGKANLKESHARIQGEEIFLINAHISPYTQADSFNRLDPARTRKLLMHKREIRKLVVKTRQKGYTLVPTRMYFKQGKAKVEIGLAIGKKHYDKRETLKKKDAERDMQKAAKQRGRKDG
ncbi:MAG: SsrA-binding protein SmpB [Thermodesulfobacteriota bacterium]